MTDIPRGAISRTAKLVGLPLGHAGRAAIGVGKRVGGRPAEVVAAELQARTAEQLFAVLGQLKGGAMKFGQALSVMEAAMPEELAAPYRATLTKLQESGPPMGADRVHEILARELGPHGIRANAICPGSVNGPRIDAVIEAEASAKGLHPDAVRAGYAAGTALKRLTDPEDVADMALFLASDAAKMVSGQALAVDGMTYNVDPQ